MPDIPMRYLLASAIDGRQVGQGVREEKDRWTDARGARLLTRIVVMSSARYTSGLQSAPDL